MTAMAATPDTNDFRAILIDAPDRRREGGPMARHTTVAHRLAGPWVAYRHPRVVVRYAHSILADRR